MNHACRQYVVRIRTTNEWWIAIPIGLYYQIGEELLSTAALHIVRLN